VYAPITRLKVLSIEKAFENRQFLGFSAPVIREAQDKLFGTFAFSQLQAASPMHNDQSDSSSVCEAIFKCQLLGTKILQSFRRWTLFGSLSCIA
jgi:hypothetical protein